MKTSLIAELEIWFQAFYQPGRESKPTPFYHSVSNNWCRCVAHGRQSCSQCSDWCRKSSAGTHKRPVCGQRNSSSKASSWWTCWEFWPRYRSLDWTRHLALMLDGGTHLGIWVWSGPGNPRLRFQGSFMNT